MDRQSLQKLRLDRRLAERTGWIPREELDRELSALPDVSDKLTTLGEAEEENKAAASAARAGRAGGAPSEPQAPDGGAQRAASPEGTQRGEAEHSRTEGEQSREAGFGTPESESNV